MKSIHFVLCLLSILICNLNASASAIQIQFTPTNISCYNGTDGSINAQVSGGSLTYTSYVWTDWNGTIVGGNSFDLTGVPAGEYTLTVTDDFQPVNNVESESIILTQPNALSIGLLPSMFASGHNISCSGLSDGSITADVMGGTPPYSYVWSSFNSGFSELRGIQAGYYSVTVTDNNGCTFISSTIQLTEPPLLEVVSAVPDMHNGFAVSCFKGDDGYIDLTVTGGAGNNSFQWSNGSFSQDPNNLKVGSYSVIVTDINGCTATNQFPIILDDPDMIGISLTPFVYPNLYNISCWNCFNGSISSSVFGGVAPYNYLWSPTNETTPNIASLDAGAYSLEVTDANGCIRISDKIGLKQPDRDDWRINGNADINSSNYLGTSDQADLIIKTNSIEQLRVTESGNVGIGTATPLAKLDLVGSLRLGNLTGSNAILRVDNSGIVSKTDIPNDPTKVLLGNGLFGNVPFASGWAVDIDNINSWNTNTGCVAIGISTFPTNQNWPTDYKLAVNGKIIATDFMVRLGPWPDYVFQDDYELKSIAELKEFLLKKKHLPGIPSSKEIADTDLSISKIVVLQMEKIEELTLYLIQLNDEIENMKKENIKLKTADQKY